MQLNLSRLLESLSHISNLPNVNGLTLFLRSWLCSLLVSVAAYGRLLLEEDGSLSRSRSLSRSLSPNQEKGMQVGMDVMDSAGLTLPPDSSSNSADPLSGFGEEREESVIRTGTLV